MDNLLGTVGSDIGNFFSGLGTDVHNFTQSPVGQGIGNFLQGLGGVPLQGLELGLGDVGNIMSNGLPNFNLQNALSQLNLQMGNYAPPGPASFGGTGPNSFTGGGSPLSITGGGGGGGGVGNPYSEATNTIQSTMQNLINTAKSQISNYESANPFNFDDYLANQATQQATATDEPYYQQQLGYYLSGITNQINKSTTSMHDILDELQTSAQNYTAQNQLASQRETYGIGENNEYNGLGSSGANLRQQGQAQAGYGASLSDFLAQNRAQQTQTQHETGFNIADIINQSNQQQQELARQNQTDIGSLANQLATNKQQSYLSGLYSLPGVTALSGMGNGFNIQQALGIPNA